MRNASLAVAMVVMLIVPAVAHSQADGPSLTVTPWGGFVLPHTASGDITFRLGTEAFSGTFEEDIDGGLALGVAVEAPIGPNFRVVGQAFWSRRGQTESILRSGGFAATDTGDGGTMIGGKLGLGLSLPIAIDATVSAAPALLRMSPGDDPDRQPEFQDPINHPALSIGADVRLPIGRRVKISLGAENYTVFWNDGDMESRWERLFARETGVAVEADVNTDISNIQLVRVGVSFDL